MRKDPIGFDSLLDLCQDQHRRIVLGALAEEQQSLTFDELTRAILDYNHHMPVTEASEDVLTGIRVSLHHLQLPRMAAEGFIEYDRENHVVESTERLEQAQPTLSTILDADPSLEAPIAL